MFSRSFAGCAALWLVLAGCSDPSSDGRVTVVIDNDSQPLLQTQCGSSCQSTTLALQLDYPTGSYTERDTIELLQYRVDYDLTDQTLEIPYYAEPLAVVVKPGDTRALTLTVAGRAQRKVLEQALAGATASGSATLQLAGYDWNDRQVFIHQTFAVRVAAQSTDAQTSE